jgi:4-amino-4-deoxy-L-arabinose transferase-like glycosyltransferase
MDGRPLRFAWMALLALALAVRLVAAVWWQQRLPSGQNFFFPDSESYWHLARSLAQGEPYRYGAEQAVIFRTPGYPIFLAPLFVLMGPEPPVLAARVLSALCGTTAVALLFSLSKKIFNEPTAWVASSWAALDPGLISQGVFVLSEAPFCPIMLAQLWYWWQAEQSESTWAQSGGAAASGVCAGIATLMRPSWLLFLPFAWGIGWLGLANQKQRGGLMCIMLLACAATMSPWWYRNYQLTGRFVPTTLQVGASLYDGLRPNATGGSEMSFVKTFIAEQQEFDASATEPPTNSFEERLNQRMLSAAVEWAKTHPTRVLELAAIKFCRIWTPWPNASDVGGFWAKLAMACGYVPVLGVLLWGLVPMLRRDRALCLFVLPAIYFTLLHCVFVGSLRYRQPAMLPLIMLAAGYLNTRFQSTRS